MRETEAAFAKTWRLRQALTSLKKAREGARRNPSGLTRLTLESIDHDERIIRAELTRRANGQTIDAQRDA